MTAEELRIERKKLEMEIIERVNTFEATTGFIVKAIRLESYDVSRQGAMGRSAVHNIECEIGL
jgi:hypothetical protein